MGTYLNKNLRRGRNEWMTVALVTSSHNNSSNAEQDFVLKSLSWFLLLRSVCNWTNKQEDIYNGTTSQIVLDTRRHSVNAVQYVFAIMMETYSKWSFLLTKNGWVEWWRQRKSDLYGKGTFRNRSDMIKHLFCRGLSEYQRRDIERGHNPALCHDLSQQEC